MRLNLLSVVIFGLLLLGWGGTTPPGVGATAGPGANRPLVAEASRPPMVAAPAVCSVVFSEGFESGTLGQFVTSMVDPDAYWVVTSPGYASSCCAAEAWGGEICCAETGTGRPLPEKVAPPGPATGAAPNAPPFEELLTTRNSFTIPASASSATLSFWWHSVMYPPYTWMKVEMSQDGGATWGVLWLLDSTMATWTQTTLDVTAYKGVPTLLRFHFYGSFNALDYWAIIDDIVLDAVIPGCVTPTPGPPQTPSRTATPTPTHAVHAGQFEDVPPGSTFYDFVECMGTRGIISGYPCGGVGEPCYTPAKPYFRPNANVTRAQASKMVVSAAGWTDPVPSTQWTFQDVPPGSTFWLWIEDLAGRGIIGGYPCGGPGEPCVAPTYRPYFRLTNNLTRGQLAKIDAQAAAFTETPTGQTFEDVPPSSTFYGWVEQVGGRGIVGGYPCGGLGEPCIAPGNRNYFRPNGNVTRGQTAKIITNSFFPNCQTPPSPTPTRTTTPTATTMPIGTTTPTVTATTTPNPTVTTTPTP